MVEEDEYSNRRTWRVHNTLLTYTNVQKCMVIYLSNHNIIYKKWYGEPLEGEGTDRTREPGAIKV